MLRTALVLFLVAASVLAEQMSFDGYKQFSVEVRDEGDALFLRDLAEQYVEIDYWLEPTPGHRTTVVVPPSLVEVFEQSVKTEGMDIQVKTEDIAEIIKKGLERTPEDEAEMKRQISNSIIDHNNYHQYGEIRDYLSALANQYPDLINIQQLNYLTHEGRPVDVAILHAADGGTRPSIIIEAGIRAREWIAPAANLYVIEKMLQGYTNGDPDALYMMNNYDWYFVPVANPDGYEFTFTTNRMWKKNRHYTGSGCYGVDLGLNFDVVFGTTGVSSNCASDIYPGTDPFSEPESSNLRDLFNERFIRVIAYVSVQSYSQFVLVPWGYTESISRPSNQPELDRVTVLMNNALTATNGMTYRHGTSWQLQSSASSGSAEDWALSTKPGIYTLRIKLRPDANNSIGFNLPANQIIPTGEELYNSYVVMAREMD